jgi:hypothetical protein
MSSIAVDARLFELFWANEPELVLVAYQSGHEAHFQLLDQDKFRIGEMVCRGVRVLCVATEYQSYRELTVHTKDTLPVGLSWMKGSIDRDEDACFAIMPSKMRGDLARYSALPRMGDQPFAYLICDSIQYREERQPGLY